MKRETTSAFDTIVGMFSRIPTRRRKQFWLILAVVFISAGVETITLGSVALMVSSVSDPDHVLQSTRFIWAKDVLNMEFPSTARELILSISLVVVGLVVLNNALRGSIAYVRQWYTAGVGGFLGEALLKGFLALPYLWHLSRNSADLVIAIERRNYFGKFVDSCMDIVCHSLVVIILISALLVVEPGVSLLIIVLLGGIAVLIFTKVKSALDRLAVRAINVATSINRQATMALHGIKDVKVYGREDCFTRDYKKDVYTLAGISALQRLFYDFPVLILETTGFVLLSVSIWFMLIFSEASTAKITGTLALLAVTAWRLLPAANKILNATTGIRNILPFVREELDYLKTIEAFAEPALENDHDDRDIEFEREIEFNALSFAYPGCNGTYALVDVNLTFPKGQTIGVIGPSGAGKTTMVDLLIGLLKPTDGLVKIDGKVLDETLRRGWTSLIGYVPQSPYIYDGTLAENVAFGFKGAEIDRARVRECCDMASMQDFLNDLPQGIDAPIGERGVRLSGGQRQRVAIARALYHNPKVIVFDEATSALDKKNEEAVRGTIYSLQHRVTLIIIAHRLSTVEQCDRIVWLENKRVKMFDRADLVLGAYRDAHPPEQFDETEPVTGSGEADNSVLTTRIA